MTTLTTTEKTENKFYSKLSPEQLEKLQKLSTAVHKEAKILILNSDANGCIVYIFEEEGSGKLRYSVNYFMYAVYILIEKLTSSEKEADNLLKEWINARRLSTFENIIDYLYDYYENVIKS